METLSLLFQFWEVAVILLVVVVEVIARTVDKNKNPKNKFAYTEMPVLRPIRIPTEGKGILSGIWIWLSTSRQWQLSEDFYYSIDDIQYVIPKGFLFDGASIPKFLRTLLSPTGLLLIGGLVHDYGYRYQHLKLTTGETTDKRGQKHFDKLFRDINIQINGFKSINYLSYLMLRVFGFFAWNSRRKSES